MSKNKIFTDKYIHEKLRKIILEETILRQSDITSKQIKNHDDRMDKYQKDLNHTISINTLITVIVNSYSYLTTKQQLQAIDQIKSFTDYKDNYYELSHSVCSMMESVIKRRELERRNDRE